MRNNLSWGSFYSLDKIGKYNNGMLKGNAKGGTAYGTRINFNEKDYYRMSEHFDKTRQEIEMIDWSYVNKKEKLNRDFLF